MIWNKLYQYIYKQTAFPPHHQLFLSPIPSFVPHQPINQPSLSLSHSIYLPLSLTKLIYALVMVMVMMEIKRCLFALLLVLCTTHRCSTQSTDLSRKSFPQGFVFGTASSSYQVICYYLYVSKYSHKIIDLSSHHSIIYNIYGIEGILLFGDIYFLEDNRYPLLVLITLR